MCPAYDWGPSCSRARHARVRDQPFLNLNQAGAAIPDLQYRERNGKAIRYVEFEWKKSGALKDRGTTQ